MKSKSRRGLSIAIATLVTAAGVLTLSAAGAAAQGPAYDQYRLTTPGESPGEARADAERRRRADAIGATGSAGATDQTAPALQRPASVAVGERSRAAIFADALVSPAGLVFTTVILLLGAAVVRYRARGGGGLLGVIGMLIAGALVVGGCGAQSEPTAGLEEGEFYGVQPRATPGAEDFKRMAEANVGTFRVFVNWSTVQPTEDGPYDWGPLDDLFTRLAFYGIQPLPYIAGVPSWLGDDAHDSPVRTNRIRRQLRAFVRSAAEQYGPGSELWSRLAASDLEIEPKPPRVWEIWNEQNSAFFWRPHPSVDQYARLLELSAEEIRAVDPEARIMVGGMFGTPAEPGSIDAWTFLRRLFRDPAVAELVDIVAVHPYATTIDGVRFQLRKTVNALRDSAAAGTPLWVTEIGWGSRPGGGLKKGAQGQARMLSDVFRLLHDGRTRWDIEGVIWFTWRDVDGLPGRRTFNASSGLLTSAGDEKPSFESYVEATGGS